MAKELTLAELQAQIEELQNKANSIIEKEKAGVIEELKEKIQQYKITADDLGFKLQAQEEPAKKAKSSTGASQAPKTPMYKNKTTGETWHGGKGAYPLWIKTICDNQLKDKKAVNKDGKNLVPKEDLIKYLDENGYKIKQEEQTEQAE